MFDKEENLIESFLEDLIKSSSNSNLEQGIIHADLFPDNVFFKNENISGLIDFYFSSNDVLILDLAICINAWCFQDSHKQPDPEKLEAILTGYQSIKPLTEEEQTALPTYCLLGSLRFFLTRSHDLHNQNPEDHITLKDPTEYYQKIKFWHANQ